MLTAPEQILPLAQSLAGEHIDAMPKRRQRRPV
jgi:hypothetical protein